MAAKINISQTILESIRPCVAYVLCNGAKDYEHFKKMRHAIVCELKRLNMERGKIKMTLLEWNDLNYNKLTPSEAQRQLCDYVDWVFKREVKIGCKALGEYCRFGGAGCSFKRKSFQDGESISFSMTDALVFLERECKPKGYTMGMVLQTLIAIKREKNVGTVFAGVRHIQEMINNTTRHCLDLMTILRALNELERTGFIAIKRGKSGTFGNRHANEYTILQWKPPVGFSIQQ